MSHQRPKFGSSGLETRIREKLADWRRLLTRNVDAGRDVLQVRCDRIAETLTGVASPRGFVGVERWPLDGFTDLRAA